MANFKPSGNLEHATRDLSGTFGESDPRLQSAQAYALVSIAESLERLVLTVETGTLNVNADCDISAWPSGYLRVDR